MATRVAPPTYAYRTEEHKSDNAFQANVHKNNVPLYFGWAVAALYRAGTWANAVTEIFRNHERASITSPATLAGTTDTLVQAASGAGAAFCLWEFVVALVVFGKDVHKFRCTSKQLKDNREGHKVVDDCLHARKSATHDAKEGRSTVDAAAARLPDNIDAVVNSYLKHEAAHIDLPAATNKVKHSIFMFLRDGIAQGASIGCAVTLLWEKYRLADLLHVVAAPVNASVTSISSGALTIVSGLLHIVAGVLALKDGEEKLSLAGRAKTKIKGMIARLHQIKENQRAESVPAEGGVNPIGDGPVAPIAHGLAIAECLLTTAKANEKLTKKKARHDIFVAKCRIGFGTAATIVGAVSLTLLLVLGGVTTGGMLFAVVGALALAGWTLYASRRNKQYLKDLEDARAAVQQTGPMTTEDAMDAAVQLFDRGRYETEEWRANKDARRLVKQALLELGMNRRDFHALRFGPILGEAATGKFREVLKIKIHHHVAGDGVRHALAADAAKPAIVK